MLPPRPTGNSLVIMRIDLTDLNPPRKMINGVINYTSLDIPESIMPLYECVHHVTLRNIM